VIVRLRAGRAHKPFVALLECLQQHGWPADSAIAFAARAKQSTLGAIDHPANGVERQAGGTGERRVLATARRSALEFVLQVADDSIESVHAYSLAVSAALSRDIGDCVAECG
jgi:hypothetical protein